MKFTRILVTSLVAAAALTGCAGQGETNSTAKSTQSAEPSPTATVLSDAWANNPNLRASTISESLIKADVCAIPDGTSSETWADTKEWANDTIRTCHNYRNYEKDAPGMVCPLDFYVTVGKDLGTSSGYQLSYEDGYDLAVVYAPGWEIYLMPGADMAMNKEPSAAVKVCKSTIDGVHATIGGKIEYNG